MIQPLLVFSDFGILILRVVLGVILVLHGLPKLKNLKGTGEWFQSIGFRPGVFWALVAGITEFLGGLALIIGFFTQVAAFLIALEFLAVLLKFRGRGMFSKEPGVELEWVILAASLILMTLTGGTLSLDSFFGWILY